MGRNFKNRGNCQLSTFIASTSRWRLCSVRNGDRVIRQLLGGNEPPNVFPKMPQWLERLYENILQVGQHFCYSAPNELLQGGRDTWRILLG